MNNERFLVGQFAWIMGEPPVCHILELLSESHPIVGLALAADQRKPGRKQCNPDLQEKAVTRHLLAGPSPTRYSTNLSKYPLCCVIVIMRLALLDIR